MKSKRQNPLLIVAIALACLAFVTTSVRAAALIWDAGNTGNGSTIDPASGNWDTTAGNAVWNDAGTNVIWSQTDTVTPLNSAVFGGTDGTVDSYVITLASQMATSALTFSNTGYKLTGSTVSLKNGASTNGSISVAAGKTATINSALLGVNAALNVTLNSGGVLNLGGGFNTGIFNFGNNAGNGATLNINGGTSAPNGATYFNAAAINQSGGDVNLAAATFIGWASNQSVNYTISGTGTLNLNSASSGPALAVGRNTGNGNTGTLTVKSGGTVNIGTTAGNYGSLWIVNTAPPTTATGNGLLDVQGGALTVGTGQSANVIMFFQNGSASGNTATMTQSGGSVTANGIQFGNTTGTYDAASLAKLQLSGGNLYVGAGGIFRGSAASALPVTIQLQGGTLGASDTWASALDMKLGTTGGGVTIKAADAAGVAKSITLSGKLSDDTAVNGTLTKTGTGTLILSGTSSTYSGLTTISAGQLKAAPAALSPNTAYTITGNSSVGGQLFFNGGLSTISSSFTLSGVGTPDVATSGITGGLGALRVFNNLTFTGPMNLAADTRIGITGSSVQNYFNGQITGSGDLEFLASVNNNDVTHTFTMGNTGTANGYAGNTTISAGDTSGGARTGTSSILKLGASDQIPNGAGKGIVVFNGPDADHQSILELNGKNETINGLSNVAAAGAVIQNTATGASTLTIGDANTSSSFSGLITDGGTGKTLAITKTGSGTLTLSGTNTYKGDTLVSAGTLALSGSGSLASGKITVAGGATFDVSGATPAYALGSSTTLGNSAPGAIISGGSNCSVGTLSLVYDGVNPAFVQTHGTMTLSASTVLTVNNTGATLGPGTKVLIAAATGAGSGAVTGTLPASVPVTGNGATGQASLTIDGSGNLNLVIGNDPVQIEDPFSAYLGSVPTILSTISTTHSGSGSSAITTWSFVFSSRGGVSTVHGIMAYPQQAGTYPGILCLHGGGGNAEGMLGLAQGFAALGYVSLTIDQPGLCSVTDTPYSDGPWKTLGSGAGPRFVVTPGPQSSTLADALIAGLEAFNLLRSQTNVNPAKMGITGTSWGGYSTTMLSGMLGTNVTAAYAQFGCGYYDKGSFWSDTVSNLTAADRNVWLTYLDAGRRAQNIKAAFFIESPSNDTYFWPPAVQATLNAIPANQNKVITPNLNHAATPSSTTMRQLYFNHHLKGLGSPFGTIGVSSVTRQGDGSQEVVMNVDLPGGVTASTVQLFHSRPAASWQERSWVPVNASPVSGSLYSAVVPAAAVSANSDFYVYLQDSRSVVVSSFLYNSVTGQSGPLPSIRISHGVSGIELSGTNETAFTGYRILSTTNLADPITTWVPVEAGLFDVLGEFHTTIPSNPATPKCFYRLAVP